MNDSNSHVNSMALYYHLKTTSRNKPTNLFTHYLSFTDPDKTNNDYKNLPHNVINHIHFFLQLHRLNNKYNNSTQVSNVTVTSHTNSPSNNEQIF
jgi:hypothetical protein